ncbi:universal stress protein [Lacinutrix sp. Bg11-31]|uniref:universal stress protein n=1 Tax=Lacinutrix sp. Bg11-31 TaxID=2057808 RepID=UPI000C305BCE|nr:universal stress protein [Lacinutrix sp. Bg11-31]AUC81154.1 universal stress protein [Lacinutrix sp. Bg11-31]
MKKILISTDFSETATNAIKYALELFKYDKCEITIIHAFADEVYENTTEMSKDYFEEYKEKVQQNVDRKLQKVIAEMLELSPNPRHVYNRLSRFGSIVDVINDFVDSENIDVVIMGTKGATNNPKMIFGSNTIKVIKYVQCPVLAVPVTYHDMHPENILFPTDYIIPFKRRELKLVSSIAMNYVSTINMLYVSKSKQLSHRQQDNQAFLDCCFDDNKFVFKQVQEDNVTETINKIIKEQSIDLLVMVNQRHSYLEDILYHSTIEKIGLEIKIPFLVLQNLRRE